MKPEGSVFFFWSGMEFDTGAPMNEKSPLIHRTGGLGSLLRMLTA